MSSISGFLASSPAFSADAARALVERSNRAMQRRGPDGQGVFQDGPCTLGHTRLAVADAGSAGAQLITRDGVTLVFDGVLYNFQEERALLEKESMAFSGRSDVEVALCMYLRYGEAFLPRLRGAYAFALWDARTRTLLCARDPLGIKPLLFSCRPAGFLFASEIKGLLASGLVPRAINPTALYALLLRGSVPQRTHILQHARWLGPGDALTVRAGEDPQIRPFCRIAPPQKSIRASWPELVEETTRQIKLALQRQMRVDVPVGAFLSGGIDSSLLVALIQQEYGQVRTFSVGFEAGLSQSPEDETDDAAAVARHLGVTHSTIILTQQDALDSLPAIAAALDHPTVDGVNAYFAARAAKEDVAVAVSGTGGDELFAGYPWFSAMQQWSQKTLWHRVRNLFARHKQQEEFCAAFDRQYAISEGLLPRRTRKPPRLAGKEWHRTHQDQSAASTDKRHLRTLP